MTDGRTTRVAILGGGVASMTAAFELTSEAQRGKYDVTVYQTGWRLGGKGASGRNLHHHDRIEEHGLHIWLGFYFNAFRVMQECYRELGRPAGAPLASWEDAFKKHNLITLMEKVGGEWTPWSIHMPPNDRNPGENPACLSLMGAVRRLVEYAVKLREEDPIDPGKRVQDHVHLRNAHELARSLEASGKGRKEDFHALAGHLVAFKERHLRALDQQVAPDTRSRRRAALLDLAVTIAKGVLVDVLARGETSFDVLDQWDLRAWLQTHHISPGGLDCPFVTATYEIVFGYEKGSSARPDFAAGCALRFLLRWVFLYQGAMIYEMQAGMGDVVFAPLYLVLKERGVKFRFFHRVESLHLTEDKSSVDRIVVGRQVTLRGADYDPLVPVRNLPCWPSEPLWDQIDPREVEELQALGAKYPGLEPLEHLWSPWTNREEITLEAGRDFDLVVLGISLGALKHHCRELVDASPKWRAMVDNVQTVQTQACQLWLDRDAADLGFHGSDSAILDSFEDSWADFSHLIHVEDWPAGSVKSIAYLCKALDEETPPPEPPAPEYQVARTDDVKRWSRDELISSLWRPVWPRAYDPATGSFRWDYLVDLRSPSGEGKDRFDYQYWRANTNPTDRYVQAIKDTTQYRLRAGESGFRNLYLAGDWLRTGINAGCVEAATMGGMQAARAISGLPKVIHGEDDFCFESRPGCIASALRLVEAVVRWFRSKPPAPPSREHPLYVDRGGEQVFPQPFRFEGVASDIFMIEAGTEALRGICDKYLNQPAGGEVRYHPLGSRVLLAFTRIARARPTQPPESEYGFVSEVDVALWVPVVGLRGGASRSLELIHVAWFLPYVFVDNIWALVSGREIFGFPKEQLAHLEPGALVVRTLAVTKPGNKQIQYQDLIRIEGPAGDGEPGETWTDHSRLLADLHRHVFDGQSKVAVEGLEFLVDLSGLFHLNDVRMVFLKQFRDVADGRRACYQAIVEASARITEFDSAESLPGKFGATFQPSVTHPIATEMGFAQRQPPPIEHAWRLRFAFEVGCGREVWRA